MRRTEWGPIEISYRVDWLDLKGGKNIDKTGFGLTRARRPAAGERGCSSSLNSNEFALNFASNSGLRGAHVDIHFGANAEFRKVDAGFDGEAGSGDDAPLIVSFQIVHVGAGAMHLFTDGVAGAMDEVFAKSLVLYIGPGGVIDVEAVNDFAAQGWRSRRDGWRGRGRW